MTVKVVQYIDINEETIINSIIDGTFDDLDDAVNDYVCGLDDCDYYALDDDAIKQIKTEVMKNTFVQKKLS